MAETLDRRIETSRTLRTDPDGRRLEVAVDHSELSIRHGDLALVLTHDEFEDVVTERDAYRRAVQAAGDPRCFPTAAARLAMKGDLD